MHNIMKEFLVRNVSLTWTGLIHLFLIPIILLLSLVDTRMVTGAEVWFKPMKFAISISIFSFTMAWFIGDLPESFSVKKKIWLGRTLSTVLILEMGIIFFQAGRGVGSHFNIDTVFDSILFSIMGIGINILTIISLWVFSGFFRNGLHLPKFYKLGLRFGVLCFILSAAAGYIMVSNLGHSVGIAEDAKGMLFLNWKLDGGDLRISHFIGMHAIQILPLSGMFLDKKVFGHKKIAMYTVTFLYLVITCLALVVALMGIGLQG
ncbi:MAG: hypothetical protein JJT78_10695 [Leptospira sp.]|nr:hypothetical protein [Leptospira sp.]